MPDSLRITAMVVLGAGLQIAACQQTNTEDAQTAPPPPVDFDAGEAPEPPPSDPDPSDVETDPGEPIGPIAQLQRGGAGGSGGYGGLGGNGGTLPASTGDGAVARQP